MELSFISTKYLPYHCHCQTNPNNIIFHAVPNIRAQLFLVHYKSTVQNYIVSAYGLQVAIHLWRIMHISQYLFLCAHTSLLIFTCVLGFLSPAVNSSSMNLTKSLLLVYKVLNVEYVMLNVQPTSLTIVYKVRVKTRDYVYKYMIMQACIYPNITHRTQEIAPANQAQNTQLYEKHIYIFDNVNLFIDKNCCIGRNI